MSAPGASAASTGLLTEPWWRGAVTYQVYIRSFADGNGDGVGDLRGLRQKLGYLADLGVDAIWLNPCFPSPMADAGYDISDYRDIEPSFGTLAEMDALIADAHERGIRILLDIVPNHCSDRHPRFQEALAAAPRSPQRSWFWFRPGRGPNGDEPPNNWRSHFGGPAWTRVTEPDGTPGQWYLHLFASEQPDFNWENPAVREDFLRTLRFWFDRGVDGFRIDSAALLVKDPLLPDLDPQAPADAEHPHNDRDGIHEIYQEWRAVADSYEEPRVLFGEVWIAEPGRFAKYLRPQEMHAAFNFPFLQCAWDPAALRTVIERTMAFHRPVGAPATWVLSNHDVTRHVTRYGRAETTFDFDDRGHGRPVDFELGRRRARAAALLCLSLPGGAYLYQGEELGLWEVEEIPDELRDDPMWHRTAGENPGRDGCRVPLPWSGGQAPFGFSADADAQPWLPVQPASWRDYSVEVQLGDPGSMLELYRTALTVRKTEPGFSSEREALRWLESGPDVLAFRRGEDAACIVNLSAEPVALPAHESVLLVSAPLTEDGLLPSDSAVWLRLS
ncbi:glycoside hydrolase family 13 protein [Actinospica robiniae]|uniref:glycoside hydrolase family 13 protein n=1 Tax=Actinospica robiniae TaxID=304901 RepID=UPI0006856DC3